jgi:hypothetical protein
VPKQTWFGPRVPRAGALAAAGLVAAVGLTASPGFAAHPGGASESKVYACYSDTTGEMFRVTSTTTCLKGETKISWNVQGPQGAQGSRGKTGAHGAQGPQGVQGAAGPKAPKAPRAPKDLGVRPEPRALKVPRVARVPAAPLPFSAATNTAADRPSRLTARP